MKTQDIKAVTFSLGLVAGSAALCRAASLPVYLAAYILGSSFMAQMQAGVVASSAAATLIGKVTLFPWVSSALFTAATLVTTAGLIYLAYKGVCAALNFVRGRIAAGDLKSAQRLTPIIKLLAYLPGPSLKDLAGTNRQMMKLILQIGRESASFGAVYKHHFVQSETHIQWALLEEPIDKELVELALHFISFKAETNVGALVATMIKSLDLSEEAEATFVQKLKEASYTEHSPIFEGEYVWNNPQPFIDAGYSEALFKVALNNKRPPSGALLFDVLGLKPSNACLESALAHPKGEALARDLIRRGYKTEMPFHKTASTAVAREFYQSGKYALDRRDSGGNTPLHAAAAQGFEGPLSYYRQLGLDIQAKNAKGELPFDLACKYGHPRIVRNLLETGGFCEGPYNTMAWVRAASRGDLDLLKAFVGAGQDLFVIGWDDKSALDLATEYGHQEAALWLAEQMRKRGTGLGGWINPKYPRAIEKAAANARESGHVELSLKLREPAASGPTLRKRSSPS